MATSLKVSSLFVFLTVLCPSPPASAAEFSFTPSISVSEEFNDNILGSAHDRRTEFVTRLQPGAAVIYRAPSLNGDLSYNFDYHNYARGIREDQENHLLALRAGAELVQNFFFLELSDSLSRVSLDVARDVTTESLFADQADRNQGTVSPYLLWRFGMKSALKTGYRFTDTSYWSAPGIDKREHRAFADLTLEPAERLSISAGYSFGRVLTDLVDYDQHDINSGFRYEFAERSFIYGGIGNSWQSFSYGRSASNLFWHGGLSRESGLFLAALESRVRYTDDPLAVSTKETLYTASLERKLEQGRVGVSTGYSKYLDTSTDARDRRKAIASGFLSYEFSPHLATSFTVTGDKVSRSSVSDYAYRLSGTAGVSYVFNYDVTASLSYSYIEYRRDWENSADAKLTNRVILSLKKTF